MRLLITGSSGFIGRSVTRELALRAHTLFAFVRPTSDTKLIDRYLAGVSRGVVTDPLAMVRAADGSDAVVHLAADLSHWGRRRERVFRTNVGGTRVAAEAAKTAGVPLLLHVSSVAAVGHSTDGRPVDEEHANNFIPLRLVYHESKRLAEEEANDVRRYGVRVIIVNPSLVYGPRELDHTFGHTMLEIAAGRVPGHPTGGQSVVDVDDVAAGIAAALERGRSGERYILGGENVSYAELFARQAAAAGVRYRGRTLPASLLRLAALGFEARSRASGAEPRLSLDHAKIAPLRLWYSSAKAAGELGWSARPLDATLERMAIAYRAAGLLPSRSVHATS